MSKLTQYDAISLFLRIYDKAIRTPYVQKPISWALYQTWKEFDKREKPRKMGETE